MNSVLDPNSDFYKKKIFAVLKAYFYAFASERKCLTNFDCTYIHYRFTTLHVIQVVKDQKY